MFIFTGGMILFMGAFWLRFLKTRNPAWVDYAWVCAVTLGAMVHYFFSENWTFRNSFLLLCVLLWGGRLSTHLFIRLKKGKKDSRYTSLMERWKENPNRNFFFFYQAQGVLAALLTYVFWVPMQVSRGELTGLEIIAIVLFLFSFLLEGVSDTQLKSFVSQPENQGKVCDVGLWKYSRHPNYFFEICLWWSWGLFALSSPRGETTLWVPLLMTFLIVFVTGVPPAETQSLKSKGDAYRHYQKTTSVLIPWWKSS